MKKRISPIIVDILKSNDRSVASEFPSNGVKVTIIIASLTPKPAGAPGVMRPMT